MLVGNTHDCERIDRTEDVGMIPEVCGTRQLLGDAPGGTRCDILILDSLKMKFCAIMNINARVNVLQAG
jgi:hypothetical protein